MKEVKPETGNILIEVHRDDLKEIANILEDYNEVTLGCCGDKLRTFRRDVARSFVRNIGEIRGKQVL